MLIGKVRSILKPRPRETYLALLFYFWYMIRAEIYFGEKLPLRRFWFLEW